MLQATVSSDAPASVQPSPPSVGGGLSQDRVRVCNPPPHLAVQLVNCDHRLYPPSTKI